MMLLPLGLGAEAISETYTCGHAAQDLSISSNADCYPAHSAENILGDCLIKIHLPISAIELIMVIG